jgi:two-component SAPR family response regulator
MFLDDPLGAINFICGHQVDAAFLDIKMPTMNGIDLAKKLIEINPKLKVFFITAYTFDEQITAQSIGSNFAGYCYKPYDNDLLSRQLDMLVEENNTGKKREIRIKTFEGFDVFINGKPVDFRNKKSKEMLAYAVNKKGSFVSMEETILALWPEKDADLARISYRDSVWKLRRTLNENRLDNLVLFDRGRYRLNTDGVDCDLFDVLNNNSKVVSIVSYMPGYDWSVENEEVIMDILEKKMEEAQ